MIKKIIIFIKHYWIFILLAAMVGSLLVIRLNQKNQPSSLPVKPTPSPQTSLSKPKINGLKMPQDASLNLSEFFFPPQLKIYRGQEAKISENKAKKIARELGFFENPRESKDVSLGKFYTWTEKDHFLSIALDANKIEYGLDFYQAQIPTQGNLPSPEEAKTILENLLEKLEIKPDLEIKWQKEEYLIQDFYFLSAPKPETADFIKIGFNPAIGQYQLTGPSLADPLVYIILDKRKEIIHFQYQIYFSSFESLEVLPLKTEEKIQETLVSEGKIVYVKGFEKIIKEPEIIKAQFNRIALTYFQEPEKNKIIQPIFILDGQGVTTEGTTTEITAFLPALSFEENIFSSPTPKSKFTF